jgi:hypothetical protein
MQHDSKITYSCVYCKRGHLRVSAIISLFITLSVLLFVSGAWAKGNDPSTFAGVELKIANEKVPAGGMLQVQVSITEPKPIMKGRQRVAFSSPLLGSASGINLFSPAGDVSGVAVRSGKALKFFFSSPLASLGTDSDYPIMTMAIPVLSSALPGQTAALKLDPTFSTWTDASSNNYPVNLKSGVLTVGGTFSVSNISPGSGVVPAGVPIAISGIGFRKNLAVKVKDARIASSTFVSSSLIRITLTASINMENRRVQVQDPGTNETAVYFSYQRPTSVGASSHTLVANSYALFARKKRTLGYFRSVLSGTAFTALSLQNPGSASTTARLDLLTVPGSTVITSNVVTLGANTRITRDLREFFPTAVPDNSTEVKVTSAAPIQMLGLVGDDATGVMLPVTASATP